MDGWMVVFVVFWRGEILGFLGFIDIYVMLCFDFMRGAFR